MKLFKNLYSWVLKWAESPYGPIALLIFAFAEAIFFPVPADVLFIALAMASTTKSFRFALNCTIGSVLGSFAGYAVGHFAWISSNGDFTSFANFFFNNIPGFSVELFNNIKALYNKYDFWVVFAGGFTPFPFKIITISSGVFDINLFMFFLAALISRGTRFFLVAFLIWKFGPKIKTYIDKYFNKLAIAFIVLLIGIFFTVRYLN